MTKASLLGTSALSDAFTVAYQIPNLFRRLFAEGSISVAFIPTFKEYLLEPGKGEAIREFLSSMLSFLTAILSLAVGLGILAAPLIAPLFQVEALDETILLTRIMFPYLGLVSLGALFQGILNSVRVFTPSGLAPILLNLSFIVCAYALAPLTANPARAMALGILAGGFLEAAVQFPFVLRRGFRFGFVGLKRALSNPGTRKVLRLIGPTIIGMAAYQLNNVVSTSLAGAAGPGVATSLSYSLHLQELILGVFAVSLGTVLLPDLTDDAKTGAWDRYNERLISAMDLIALITVPISFIALAQGDNLIRLLFESNSFDDASAALTRSAFNFHMPGLLFIALNRILAPAFYAQSDSRSPALAGIVSFGINIILALILAGPLRGGGIALALSAASAVNTALLLAFLGKNKRIAVGRALRSALGYTAKLAVFSAVAVAPVLWIGPRLTGRLAGRGRLISYGLPFAASALLFAAIGIGLLVISRDKQARNIAAQFRRKR
jgi:putative peptidoglycan lipid II flippase